MIVILIFNQIYDYHLFSKSIWTWGILIGIGFVVMAPLSFVLNSVEYSVKSAVLGAVIAVTSSFCEVMINPPLDETYERDKIEQRDGQDPNSNWSILLYYHDGRNNDSNTFYHDNKLESVEYNFKGSITDVDKFIVVLKDVWNKLHPESPVVKTSRGMY